MNLGTSIKELRKQKNLSQVELAHQANMTQATLSKIENGVRPNDESLGAISKALGVPPSLIIALSLERQEVLPDKQGLYDQLFPVIKSLILQLSVKD